MIGFLLAAAAATATLPSEPDLTKQIAARDTEFFDVFFNRCEPERVRAMVTGDVEFYHDRGGVIARNADAFVADYAKSCREKEKPDAWRSRRALVSASLQVWPIAGYGAIEEGDHLFYERKGDGPEKLVGKAHFVIVWRTDPDGWKMARALSYGHGAASE